MLNKITSFFAVTPQSVDIAIAATLTSLGVGFGWAIAQSDKLAIASDWITIENQAISNQKDLERSLLIIQIQKAAIAELKEDARDFSRRYTAGREILEQAEAAAEVIPDEQIENLEQAIEDSRLSLDRTPSGHSKEHKQQRAKP